MSLGLRGDIGAGDVHLDFVAYREYFRPNKIRVSINREDMRSETLQCLADRGD